MDPDREPLADAYAHEEARADAMQDTIGMAWLFALVPVSLVLLLLQALLGDWVWKLLPVLFIVGAFGGPLLGRLAVRWRSDLPLALPGRAPLAGARKRWWIAAAMALVVGVLLVEELVGPWAYITLREWLSDWRI